MRRIYLQEHLTYNPHVALSRRSLLRGWTTVSADGYSAGVVDDRRPLGGEGGEAFEGRAAIGYDHGYDAEVFYLALALDPKYIEWRLFSLPFAIEATCLGRVC
jgi:hypothetical protein